MAPKDADAFVLVTSVKKLDANASQLMTSMQLTTMASLEQLLTVMGVRNGMDMSRGALVAMDFPDDGGEGAVVDPMASVSMAFVLPVSDFATFAGNFVPDLAQQRPGIHRFEYFGREYYIKSVDGRYALIAESAEAARSFEPAGSDAFVRELLGERGTEALGSGDVGVCVNLAKSSSYVRAMMDRPEVGMAMSAFPKALGVRSIVEARVDEMLRDGKGFALSATPGQLGLSLGAVVNYREGTPTRALCEAGSEGGLIDALPSGTSYLVAGVDMSHPAMEKWFAGVAPNAWIENVEEVTVGLFMPNPPMLRNGALSRAVLRYEAEDPSVQLRALADALLDDSATTHRGEHAEAFKTYDEVPINGWSFFPSDPAMIDPSLIGVKGDILGASAAHGGAGYVFTTRDRAFIRSALGTDGSDRLLEADRVMGQVRGLLPDGASAEVFVSPKPVLEEFAGMVRMFVPTFKVSPQVPPAGMNVTIGGGAAKGTAFMPATTLAHVVEIVRGVSSSSMQR